jgi:uncharacterized protein YgbK (DUF1537 family)
MLPYAVVADDLTGAGDTGVQFAMAGLRTRLLFGAAGTAADADVLVCNTDSRALPAGDAGARVRSAVAAVRALGAREVYKKVDSTLRGNLGAELDAVLDAFPGAFALLCPAFPANGRTVVGGHLLVAGEPVSRTVVSRDPACPITESYIPDLVARQSSRRAGRLDLSAVVAGPDAATDKLQELLAAGVAVVVADAVSDGDLACLAAASRRVGRPAVLVGAAGLAAPLAAAWSAVLGRSPRAAAPMGGAGQGKVLAVVGSVHTAARDQLTALAEQGLPVLQLDAAAALGDEATWNGWLSAQAGAMAEAFAAPVPSLVLTTAGAPADVALAKEVGRTHGLAPGAVPQRLAARLAEFAEAAIAAGRVTGLALTGGDTAAALLGRLGATGLDLTGEVGPGIAAGRLTTEQLGEIPVVTKAGGFGGRDALWQAVKYLSNQQPVVA